MERIIFDGLTQTETDNTQRDQMTCRVKHTREKMLEYFDKKCVWGVARSRPMVVYGVHANSNGKKI